MVCNRVIAHEGLAHLAQNRWEFSAATLTL